MSAGLNPPATDWWLGLAARGQPRAAKIRVSMKGAAAASFLLRVGEVAEKAEKKKKRVNVKVLDKKRIPHARALRVVVKGGRIFTFRISRPVLNPRKLVLYKDDAIVMVTSLSRLAIDIEEYFKKQNLEPLYIYPASQSVLVE
ncbi:MAG: hypothetical protein LM590_13525 [Thermofilum sp.]|nr:hypothetical protein [Thermofilum sp.]